MGSFSKAGQAGPSAGAAAAAGGDDSALLTCSLPLPSCPCRLSARWQFEHLSRLQPNRIKEELKPNEPDNETFMEDIKHRDAL